MPATSSPPLVLTLSFDEATQLYFNSMRKKHFPPKINYLGAHLTLFHHLPIEELTTIRATLRQLTAAQQPLPLQVTGVRSLGRGVAFNLENPQLRSLHHRLQIVFASYLTAQDQQKLQPHVTIQNKVDPTVARRLLAELQAEFTPFETLCTGLHLWEYRGGPWESIAEFPFGVEPEVETKSEVAPVTTQSATKSEAPVTAQPAIKPELDIAISEAPVIKAATATQKQRRIRSGWK